MLLREMTDPTFARAFKRFARLAGVGIALAGLTACGGGGGGGSSTPTPTTPELTITPVDTSAGPEASSSDLVGAQAIASGEEITASLASADDVKFYRLEVAEERSEIEFTLDAEAGIEIAILDGNGYVIATAETESMAKTTVSAAGRTLYVRVRDKAKRGWDALNRTKAVKTFKLVSDVVAVARNLINLYKGIPHFTLAAGGAGFEFDLRDHFTLPDGRRIVSSVTASLPGVSASIQGTTVRLASGDVAHGGVRFVLRLCIPIVGYCFTEAFSGTIGGRRGPTLSDVPCTRVVETTCIHDEAIALGGTYTSRRVAEYFDYPAGTQIRFVQAATMTPRVEGWTHRIVDGKLVVTVPSDPDADRTPRDNLLIYLSAVDPDGGSARRLFSFTIEEDEAPTISVAGLPVSCKVGGKACRTIYSVDIYAPGQDRNWAEDSYGIANLADLNGCGFNGLVGHLFLGDENEVSSCVSALVADDNRHHHGPDAKQVITSCRISSYLGRSNEFYNRMEVRELFLEVDHEGFNREYVRVDRVDEYISNERETCGTSFSGTFTVHRR